MTKLYVTLFFLITLNIVLAENNVYIDKGIDINSILNIKDKNSYHVFSHGRSGELFIDGKWKNVTEITSFLKPLIHSSNPKIQHLNIYGCEFAKGANGKKAVEYIEKELGISVAASTNITGKDGDWILEIGDNSTALNLPNFQGNLQGTYPSCTYGAISSNQYVTSATGNSSWGTNTGVVGPPDITSAALDYSTTSANEISIYSTAATLTFPSAIYAGDTAVFWVRNYPGWEGGFSISVGGTAAGTIATVQITSTTAGVYNQVKLVLPAGVSGNSIVVTPVSGAIIHMDAAQVIHNYCYPCAATSTPPAITATTVMNTCPAMVPNLTTLTNTGIVPSGSTLVWSTHNPPTSASDTLTTAQVQAAAGTHGTKYYAYYRNSAGACFSPADSVTFNQTCCFGTISYANYVSSATGNANTSWGTDAGVLGAPNITSAATDVLANRWSVNANPATATFVSSIKAGDTITLDVAKWSGYDGGFIVSVGSTPLDTITSPELTATTYPYNQIKVVVPSNYTGTSANITLTPTNLVNTTLLLVDDIKVSNYYCNTCPAGMTAPSMASTTVSIVCPATTKDLTTNTSSNLPANSSISWHRGTPATSANLVLNPTAVGAGVYYAAFVNGTGANACYSGISGNGIATTPVIVTADSDCDGIYDAIDIDDDNDGVLDAVESPDCYYTASEIDSIASISTGMANTGVVNNMRDGSLTTTFAFTNAAALTNDTVFAFNMLTPVALDTVKINLNTTTGIGTAAGAKAKLQAWDGSTWVDLDTGIVLNGTFANKSINFPVVFNKGIRYLNYRILGTGGTVNANAMTELSVKLPASFAPSSYAKPLCSNDTDGDGIVNQLDLDSDGDGCTDTYESEASIVVTDSIASAPYGGNGFSNSLQATTDTNAYKSSYTYSYATSKSFNVCADTDNDGISDLVDIDDDNDGVLDAVESPDCYYTASEIDSIVSISTGMATTGTVTNMNDGSLSPTFAFTNTSALTNDTVFAFNMLTPVALDTVKINLNTTTGIGTATTAKAKLQAWNGSTWVDLDTGIVLNGTFANKSINFPVVFNKGINYQNYRILGTGGTVNASAMTELTAKVPSTFVSSSYPKITCTNDADGDGILNQLDRDSDNDGCSDTYESSASTVIADSIAPAPYGGNGFSNSFQSTSDTNSFISSYSYANAIDTSVKSCIDTDGDGVGNTFDIDDDNDGVLDVLEMYLYSSCLSCAYDPAYQYISWPNIPYTGTYYSNPIVGAATVKGTPITATITTGVPSIWGNDGPFQTDKFCPQPNGTPQYSISSNANSTVHTIVFDKPVLNPRLMVSSLNTGMTFSQNVVHNASGTFVVSNSIAGCECAATVIYPGVYTSISWTGGTAEFRMSISLAIENVLPVNTPTYVDPNPTVGECTNIYSEIDTDGDGIPNRLDKDSDNDGCSDAFESGTVTAKTDSIAPAPYGGNGFSNSLQATTDTNAYKSSYTYSYATSKSFNVCADTDNDGIFDLVDIDDDNDGVLDAVESPDCYYTAAEIDSITSISTGIATTGTVTNMNDGSLTPTFAFTNTSALTNDTVFAFNMLTPVALDTVKINLNTTTGIGTAAGAKAKLQAWDGSTWVDLDTGIVLNGTFANKSINFPVVFNKGINYQNYRILGTGGTVNANAMTELTVKLPSTYSASSYPKISCTNDTDGDGILNQLDKDSDGDGCSDAFESGTVTVKTDSIAPAPYGGNGFSNSLQATTDTNVYKSTYTYNYAVDSNASVCLDTDGDGVGDLVDLDDDNDGVLDSYEIVCPKQLFSGTATFNSLGSVVTLGTNIANLSFSSTNGGQTTTTSTNGSIVYTHNETPPYTNTYTVVTTSGEIGVVRWGIGSGELTTASGVATEIQKTTVSWNGGGSAYVYNPDGQITDMNGVSIPTGTYISSGTSINIISRLSPSTSTWYLDVNTGNASKGTFALTTLSEFPVKGTPTEVWEIGFPTYMAGTCADLDTDGDGIPNRLDKDSDNDGCSDAFESGTVTAKTDSIAPAPYGGNGFSNSLQATTDTNAYKSSYTYSYATSKSFNVCADTDNDGIFDLVDIDDDNDGVLDAVESPDCYYTAAEIDSITSISTGIATTGTVTNMNDGSLTPTFAFTNTSALTNDTVFAFNMLTPVALDTVKINLNTTTGIGTAAGAKAKLQAWDGSTWVDLDTGIVLNGTFANKSINFPVVFNKGINYQNYRILGTGGTVNANAMTELTVKLPSTYSASSYPKISCTNDTDGDGILNQLDKDSDGDGCSDAFESGTVTAKTDSIVPAPYDGNGFSNSLQSSIDTNVYKSIYTYYYAVDSNASVCIDTDGDGVGDLIDIDDDNDGVLDVNEQGTCSSTGPYNSVMPFSSPILADVYKDYTISDNSTSPTVPSILSNKQGTVSVPTTGVANSAEFHSLSGYDGLYTDHIEGSSTTTPISTEWNTAGGYNLVSLEPGSTSATSGYLNLNADPIYAIDYKIPITKKGNVMWHFKTGNQWVIADADEIYIEKANGTKIRYSANNSFGGTTNNVNLLGGAATPGSYSPSMPVEVGDIVHIVAFETIGGFTGINGELTFCGTDLDTDGDGILNQYDKDSDDDGCSDAFESGTMTSNTPDTVSGAYGANGFANSLQKTTDTNSYKGLYTYYRALDTTLKGCGDNDKDGIADLIDIDDDNDGVLDAIESPSCFYLATEIDSIKTIMTGLPTTGTINNVKDGILTNTFAFTNGTSLVGDTIFAFTSLSPVKLDTVTIDMQQATSFANATSKSVLQAWNGANWVNLSDTITISGSFTPNNIHFPIKYNNSVPYNNYRILGTQGTVNSTSTINEVILSTETKYAASSYPKSTCTGSDYDGDGIPNHLDKDSDNDGCTDAFESGVLPKNAPDTVSAPYSGNGFKDALQKSTDTNAYSGSYTYTKAIDSNQQSCPTTPDTVTVTPMCATCPVKVCNVRNDLKAGKLDSTKLCATPTGYSASAADTLGCVTYTPLLSPKPTTTVQTCIIACKNGKCDTTVVYINPPINTDTVVKKLTCPTCPISACATADDITVNSTTTYSTCGLISPSSGYGSVVIASNGCLVYVGNGAQPSNDTIQTCIVACNGTVCDTTVVKIVAATPPFGVDTIVTQVANGVLTTKCATADDIPATAQGTKTYTSCGISPSTYNTQGTYSFNASNGCISWTANATQMDTIKTCVIVCDTVNVLGVKSVVCDTTRIFFAPPPKPDTITVTPLCPTCPVTVCPTLTDISVTSATIFSTCGTPTGYTATTPVFPKACVTYTPQTSPAPTGPVTTCIVACNGTVCDTTYIIIKKPVGPDTTTVTPACPTCPVTVCAVKNDLDTGKVDSVKTCGTPTGYVASTPDTNGCITYTPLTSPAPTGPLTTCIVACKNGICDTTLVVLNKPVSPDTLIVTPACPSCPTVICAVKDDLASGKVDSVKTCGTPMGYSASAPDTNGCITYTALTSPAPTGAVTTCIVACKNGICDTTYITINKAIAITADTIITIPACATCSVSACAVLNDIDTTGGGTTYSNCGSPTGYNTNLNTLTGCVVYTPIANNLDTTTGCVLICKNGYCDTTRIIIYPNNPTPDTVVTTPTCSSCPVTVCPVVNDIDTTGGATYSTCTPAPAGYSVTTNPTTGCTTYTPNANSTDTVETCIITCKNGVCDTTKVTINPKVITPDTVVTTPTCSSCPITVCPVVNDIDTTGGATYSTCTPAPTGYSVTTNPTTGCTTYTPNANSTDTVETCIITCKNGVCDTTKVTINPKVITPDTVVTTPTCSSCPVTVCPVINDIDTTGGGTTYSMCTAPTGYSAAINPTTGCVTYTPTSNSTSPATTCIITCKNGVCDTTKVTINPKVITPDTVVTTPTCSSCPITVCPVVDDIDTTGGATYSTCTPAPTGYSVTMNPTTGCTTYTPNANSTDTVETCIITCKNGVCDTTKVTINPKVITPDTVVTTPTCSSCPITVCPVVDDIDTTGGAIYSTCTPAPTGYSVTTNPTTGCTTYTPNANTTDTVETCIITCKNGVCDTTKVTINPKVITPDTVVTTPTCSSCPVTVCPVINDIDTTGGGTTYSMCTAPTGYSAAINPTTGCVTYMPTSNSTSPATTCIITCKNGVCDTTKVTINPKVITPDTVVTTPTCSSCPITVCPVVDDIDTTGGATYSTCTPAPTGYSVTTNPTTGCTTYTPNANTTDTVETCIITCKNGVCDTTKVTINPKVITPDTVVTTPTCSSCPITVCPVINDIDTTGGATYSTCTPAPTGYSVTTNPTTGCTTYTPNANATDTVETCIITCKNGVCDTTKVIIVPKIITPDTTTVTPTCASCPISVCPVVDDIDTTGGATYSTCTPAPTGYSVTTNPTTGCTTYTPNANATDTVETCIITCKNGVCDTTKVTINPKVITPDTIVTTPTCSSCPVTVCSVINDIDTTGGATYSTCTPAPAGYSVTTNPTTGCTTYTPNANTTTPATTCIITCKNGVCDTTKVTINPKIITPDTVVTTPTCSSCPVTVCPVINDIDTTSGVTYSTCTPAPTGYSVTTNPTTGCTTYTPNANTTTPATTCIITCKNGVCDTTKVTINPKVISPDTIVTTPTCASCPITVCPVVDDIDTTGGATYSTCTPAPTGYSVTTNPTTGCTTYTSNANATDTVETCIITCKNGVCDTTKVIIVPKVVTPDTVITTPTCASCPITVCPVVDDIDTTGGATYSTCTPAPAGYSVTTNPTTGCTTYTPNANSTDTVETCIITCKNGVCDTTKVIIVPKIVTPDTTTVTPTCASCPVTACPIIDDIDTTGGGTTYTNCGSPAGYNAVVNSTTGCITYTPNANATDTAYGCILVCKNGVCDTTKVIIVPKIVTPDTTTVTPTCASCPITVCPVVDDIDTTGGATYSTCTPAPTGYSVTTNPTTGCTTYTPNANTTTPATTCIITCKNGVCDTTKVTINPKVITPDTTTVTPTCASCPVTACPIIDDIDTTGGGTTYSLCGTPTGYTPVINSTTGCVTYTPNANATDTAYGCILVCKNGVCDTTKVIIVPKIITPDTTTVTPTCASCPVTACLVIDDIDTAGGGTTYSLCGTPTGYTPVINSTTGCVTYTPNANATDTAYGCILVCKNGVCDTTRVVILPKIITPDTITVTPTCASCPITVCPVVDDIDTTGGATYSTCTPAPTGYSVTTNPTTGCTTYTPNANATDTVETCIITCKNGVCDTTKVIIVPKIITPDTTTVTPTCASCPITVCPVVDDIDTTGGATYSTCTPAPAGYSVTTNPTTGCTTYTPNANATDTVETCIITCKNGVCDTTKVIIVPKIVTPDTTTVTPICASCPVTACPIIDDIDTAGGGTTYSLCGTPTGYTPVINSTTGCVTYTPNANATDTAYGCILVCKNGVCDTTKVIIVPKIATPDTVITTPTCASCPITVCPVVDDTDTTGGATYSTCTPAPAGYSVTTNPTTGCTTYTPNANATDTVETCIITCKNGVCDTTKVIIVPKIVTPDTVITTPTCASCPITVCPVVDDIDTTGGATYSTCTPAPAGYSVTTNPTTGCTTYTPNANSTDTVETCIITCKNGVCDTTKVIIVPKIVTPDTVITTPTCASCPVTACPIIDDIDTAGGGTTYSLCGTPTGYTPVINSTTGCVTYTPNANATDTVYGCILVCKNGVCDTTKVIIVPKIVTPDTTTVTPTCASCPVTACPIFDDIDSKGGGTTYTNCGLPAGYNAVVNSTTGCITYTPNGATTLKDTVFGCILVCKNGVCDTTRVLITPKKVTADTITVNPICSACPITACPVINDIDTVGGGTSYSSCGTPTGYNATVNPTTGCTTYTPNSTSVPDTAIACILICKNGICDTTRVRIVKPIGVDPDMDTTTIASTGGTAFTNIAINDSINGNQAVLGVGGNATVSTNGTWPTGFTLNPTTGAVMVASGTNPGVYTMLYNLCDTFITQTCKLDTIRITVLPVINPAPDSGTIASTGGIAISNIATNDTVNGKPAVIGSNATVSTNGTWPTGFTLNTSTGAVTVASGTNLGVYTMLYNLCDTATPTAHCAIDTVRITVLPVIDPDMDTTTIAATGGTAFTNIATNDSVNGTPAVIGSNATVSTTGTWPTGFTLNTATGAVTVAGGTTPGTYTMLYNLCDTATPTAHCQIDTIRIKVLPVIDPDMDSTTIASTGGIAISNIATNDTINGNAAVLGINASVSKTGTWPTGFSLNVGTGEVSVASVTNPGTYKMTYNLCDNLVPTNCKEDTVIITVLPVIDPDMDTATIASTGGIAINNIATNDSVNGKPAVIGSNATVSTNGTWPTGFTLNTSTGAVNVANGTNPGTYTMLYNLCDTATPTAHCAIDTVRITVLPVIDPDMDTATIASTGGIAINNIATNDSVNGTQAIIGSNVTVSTNGTWPTGFTLNTATGAVTVAGGTTPGTYTMLYNLCDTATSTAHCQIDTIRIKVLPVIDPDMDSTTIASTGGVAISNIATNDTINGIPAVLGVNAIISKTGTWPTGFSLNAGTGEVSVANGTNPGTYKMTYNLCDNLVPTNCKEDTVIITVLPVIDPDMDTATIASTGGIAISNIATNDSVNGKPAIIGSNATVSTNGSWPTGFTLNPSTGAVTVASGTNPGTYTMLYNLCDTATPTAHCAIDTLRITVLPVIDPDMDTTIIAATGGTAFTNIAINDTINGNQAVIGSNATVSTNGTWPTGFTLNPSTGAVTVASGTNPGVYTMLYNLCDTATPTAHCEIDTVRITVLPVIDPDMDTTTIAATGGTAFTNIATNDSVNGTPAVIGSNTTVSTTGTWPTGFTLNTATGAVTVAGGTTPGTYTMLYNLCDTATPTAHCQIDTIRIKVLPVIDPDMDSTTIASTGGVAISNIATNDTINGNAAVLGVASVSKTGVWPTGFSLNVGTGEVSVSNGTNPGTYKMTYNLCDNLVPTNCKEDTVIITVLPVIDPDMDTATIVSTGGIPISNIATNDSVNGNQAVIGSNATVSTNGTWPTGFTLNPSTGAVTVASGTNPGVYTMLYNLCDTATPTAHCEIDTVRITVLPVIDPDMDTATIASTGGIAISNIATNDTINGTPSIIGTNATVSTSGTWPTGFTLNTATGAVNVASGTTPGVYTMSYILCDTATPKHCVVEIIKIVVLPIANDIITTIDSGVVYTNYGGVAIVNVILNDTIEGTNPKLNVNSTIKMLGTWPAGITLNTTNGTVTVAPGTPVGVYTMTYELCDKAVPASDCKTQVIIVRVLPLIDPKPDSNTLYTNGGVGIVNIVSNDTVNGQPAVIGVNATVSELGTWPKGITLDVNTGKVNVANGTSSGRYVIYYNLCDSAKPVANCAIDSIILIIKSIKPDTVIVKTDSKLSYTVCTTIDDVDVKNGNVTYTSCGAPAGFIVTGPDSNGCYTYTIDTANPSKDTVKTCQVVCVNGVCDTTYVIFYPQIVIAKIPNYFSPNGDGVNDYFDLSALQKRFPNLKLMIYNRWGNIVWRSVGAYNNDFGGLHYINEAPLPDGVYYYLIELSDEFKEIKTGFVELMRQ